MLLLESRMENLENGHGSNLEAVNEARQKNKASFQELKALILASQGCKKAAMAISKSHSVAEVVEGSAVNSPRIESILEEQDTIKQQVIGIQELIKPKFWELTQQWK
ncbi:hypothetical protein O6P43_008724 [Quillaja saponaria]|uniref:Uncharacterized protein n=1 Tax=Quillaja saponaria TaxID=32244 RepID=A0AAD7PW87_QUISA|nr:hypothetical protein O6P43_008724 [Quillaja saponaria]